jgi:hypothetical protein
LYSWTLATSFYDIEDNFDKEVFMEIFGGEPSVNESDSVVREGLYPIVEINSST